MKSLKVVHVQWLDSMTHHGWEQADDIDVELRPTHSIGIVVAETKDALVIATSYDPQTESLNGRIHIPLCSISSCRTLCRIKS